MHNLQLEQHTGSGCDAQLDIYHRRSEAHRPKPSQSSIGQFNDPSDKAEMIAVVQRALQMTYLRLCLRPVAE